jgi:hypothetical protein
MLASINYIAWYRQLLDYAIDLVKRGWCQGALALDEANQPTQSTDPKAVAFCLMGSLERAVHDVQPDPRPGHVLFAVDVGYMRDLVFVRIWDVVGGCPEDWNDAPKRKKAQVIAALEAAKVRS